MNYPAVSVELNDLSYDIIGLAMKVHKSLGPGLLESCDQECLFYEIKKAGIFVEKEKAIPLIYDSIRFDVGYRIDLLIEEYLIVEIKSVEQLSDIHIAQVLTYLKLNRCRLGLLINFNVTKLKDGIKRLVL